MATAKLKPIEFKPPRPNVILELTAEEADVLNFVCSRIGGASETTPRGKMDSISKALVAVLDHPHEYLTEFDRRAIYFKSQKED